ncbi:WGR domain-containing protein [Salipiger mucosus]|uniref:WGR domain-containing protein n=1 Tax=Salipiger mucosus DSM 16094 TaxID=1123237 RepID=S9QWE2_9RHOB|nr:WGR domain-containing protein [Salipiger mucosus]EPX83938.1 hypothetical protein Salmuc_01713 [Salipiger mucosus DSM 16094]
MEEKSIALFLTEGSSDKEYRVQLVQDGDGWRVFAQNGRRGKALKNAEKTKEAISYDSAVKLYDKTVASKTRKGYTEDVTGAAFAGGENAGRKTAFRPMLLTAISHEEASGLDGEWLAQQKHDGERRGVIAGPDGIHFANRNGLEVGVRQPVMDDVQALFLDLPEGFVLDAEDMGDHLVVFDVVEHPQVEKGVSTFRVRSNVLAGLQSTAQQLGLTAVKFDVPVPAAEFFRDREPRMRDAGAEGYVLRPADSVYAEGRQPVAFKMKYIESCTARVKARNGEKSSVRLEMLDGDDWIEVGNVTIPQGVEQFPEAGQLIEVEYLYAYEGGSLYQPVFKGPRTDVDDEACRLGTLKFKREADAAAAPAM